MSNDLVSFLKKAEVGFEEKNTYGLVFAKECEFAKQVVMKNDFLMGVATCFLVLLGEVGSAKNKS